MKRKLIKKRMVRPIVVQYSDDIGPWVELMNEMGFSVFEDPATPVSSDTLYFVANFDLTYRWLSKNSKRYGIDPKWLNQNCKEQIEANEMLDEVNP